MRLTYSMIMCTNIKSGYILLYKIKVQALEISKFQTRYLVEIDGLVAGAGKWWGFVWDYGNRRGGGFTDDQHTVTENTPSWL